MIQKLRLVLVLSAFIIAAFLSMPTAISGVDAECMKECRVEYQECIDICKQHVKNPAALDKCIKEGCQKARSDCFNDCKECA